MEEKDHILEVLEDACSALKREEFLDIKRLSNEVIHNSSTSQDPDVISVAVILYSISKIMEREKHKDYKNWPKFYKNMINSLNALTVHLRKNNIDKFRNEMEFIRNLIQNISGSLKYYIQDVFRKASINKASKIYEHGISMEKTAKILGISIWELTEYAGQVQTSNNDSNAYLSVKERIKIAEEIFKK
ncbi:MAG: hypothetical protein WC867_04495 [Candidatus Pacearchaeota archaeon]|jgi:hypothetical protein